MAPSSRPRRWLLSPAAALAATIAACGPAAPPVSPEAPELLSQTGLYADLAAGRIAEGVESFTPQYPLWSDGAAKRRWVRLPDGATIDARDPEAWSFPVGTRFWKEFSFGRRVETRYMERAADGSWIYATYEWAADGSDARRVDERGRKRACETGLGARHDIPAVADCRACHEGQPGRVLGFGALQLASERDALAPHAEAPQPGDLALETLLARGQLDGDPAALRAAAEPIEAATPRERAALGYLHANCGGCHNARGPLATLELELEYRRAPLAPALRTALGRTSRFQPTGVSDAPRIAPGDPERSVLVARLGSRFAALQMPPLGTHAVDAEALELVSDWIRTDLAPRTAAHAAR